MYYQNALEQTNAQYYTNVDFKKQSTEPEGITSAGRLTVSTCSTFRVSNKSPYA